MAGSTDVLSEICSKRRGVNSQILKQTISLAVEIAREGREGRKIVFLMRLSPIFPYNLLNYALGLTKVRFVDYAIACVGMLPGTFLYVYYGKLLGDVAAVAGGAEVEKGWGYWTVLGLGIVATIAVTWLITRKAQAELRRETDIPVADDAARGEGEA